MKVKYVLLAVLFSNSIAIANTTCDLNGIKLEVLQTEKAHTMILTGVTRPLLKKGVWDEMVRVVVSYPKDACRVGSKPYIFTCLSHDRENNYATVYDGQASFYNTLGHLIKKTTGEDLGFVETSFVRSVSSKGDSSVFTVSIGGDESPSDFNNNIWKLKNSFNIAEADLEKKCK